MTGRKTAEECVEIVSHYLSLRDDETLKMFEALARVDGNRSFRDSMQLMLQIVRERRAIAKAYEEDQS